MICHFLHNTEDELELNRNAQNCLCSILLSLSTEKQTQTNEQTSCKMTKLLYLRSDIQRDCWSKKINKPVFEGRYQIVDSITNGSKLADKRQL